MKDFKKEVLNASTSALVYFWADWCGPCKTMAPAFEEFTRLHKKTDLKIIKIDVDKHKDIARMYSVMSVPTIFLFKQGIIAAQHVGAMSLDQLQTFFDNNS